MNVQQLLLVALILSGVGEQHHVAAVDWGPDEAEIDEVPAAAPGMDDNPTNHHHPSIISGRHDRYLSGCVVPTDAPVPVITVYDLHLDCYMNYTNLTATADNIEVKFYDENATLTGAGYLEGLECPSNGTGVSTSIPLILPPAEIRVEIYGFDACLINRAWLSVDGINITHWGFNDMEGWCLSSDEDDSIKNSWFGRVKPVDGTIGCKGCLSFNHAGVGLCHDFYNDIET